ncbi:MAG: MATE family efflux transporter [Verrucomicrobiales bacterium]|nr:MATE family efflux transporter [Verrucomicrobiales bacterium]
MARLCTVFGPATNLIEFRLLSSGQSEECRTTWFSFDSSRFYPLMTLPSRRTLLHEGRGTLLLAFPLIAGQVSQMLVGLSDTMMIGRLGVVPLAASTFANTILYIPLMIGIGMTMAVSIRVSQARGAGDPAMAREALRNGLLIAFIVGLITALGAMAIIPFFSLFGQEAEVTNSAGDYFLIVAVSMIPAIGCMAIKNHADAMNHPWPAFWISLGGVVLNILLNWILIYGKLGAPALGLEGAGIATLTARTATLVALIHWCRDSKTVHDWVPRNWFRAPDGPSMRSLVKVGLPASLQLLAEVSAFVMATFLIGTLGKVSLASHQVAITCVATIFMVPLGLSMAITVRMGEAWGAGNRERMRPLVVSGWLMGSLFSLCSAILVFLFPNFIAGWFVTEPEARALAASLLVISAFFQFSDAMQIISMGALRGVDDVNVPAWIAVFTYWGISIPVGWWFAFKLNWGASGMWWGITIGLTITALFLGIRLWLKVSHRSNTDISSSPG